MKVPELPQDHHLQAAVKLSFQQNGREGLDQTPQETSTTTPDWNLYAPAIKPFGVQGLLIN